MKALDLLTTDIGKWVVIRAEISNVDEWSSLPVTVELEGGGTVVRLHSNTNLEFITPPPPVHEVGDVFKNIGPHPAEWTISIIDGDACLLRYLTGHVSADYPLNPDLWEFVRKGAAT